MADVVIKKPEDCTLDEWLDYRKGWRDPKGDARRLELFRVFANPALERITAKWDHGVFYAKL